MQELSENGEIRAGALLINHRENAEKPVTAVEPLGTGPLQPRDMAHTVSDHQEAVGTKAAAESTVQLLGLTWEDDVEDVVAITG